MRVAALVLALLMASAAAVAGQSALQSNPDAERAKIYYRLGWESMRSEAWAEAVKQFQQTIRLDQKFKLAHYGLGRAHMGLKNFPEAARAYEVCRQLYQSQASDNFHNRQEADKLRRDDLLQLQTAIDSLSSRGGNATRQASTQFQIQQLRQQMQRIQLRRDADQSFSIQSSVPAFVSLALGSAYFGQERLADAEREYKTALSDDPNAGEAHNNLAVVYLLTERVDEAAKEVALAEKAGFRVNPQFKKDLDDKRRGTRLPNTK